MKRKVVLSVAFLLALVLTLSVMPFASAATKAQNGLQFELTTDKEAYTTGEFIQCELTVANSNDQELNISYEVILPEGLTLAATQRGVLQVAAGDKVTSDFAVQTATKGADELPATGDHFPFGWIIASLVIAMIGFIALCPRKKQFISFVLVFVLLFSAAEPAFQNSAKAEDEIALVKAEGLSEEMLNEQMDRAEQQMLLAEDEFIQYSTEELDRLAVEKRVVLDNQLVTICVNIVVSTTGDTAANAKTMLATPTLKPITILGTTKFTLTWNKVAGATHYEVWHSYGNGYIKRATCVGTTWTTNYGKEGYVNTYKVRAIKKVGSTIVEKGNYATRTCYGMDAATINSVTKVSNGLKIDFTVGSYCNGFNVYYSATGASGTYTLLNRALRVFQKNESVSLTDTAHTSGYYKIRPQYKAAGSTFYYSGPASNGKGVAAPTPEPYGSFNKTTITLAQGQTATFTVSGGVKNSTNLVYSVNGARPDGSGLGISSWVGHKVTGQSTFSKTFTINAASGGEFYTPGTYTLNLWVRDASVQTSKKMDSMTVVVTANPPATPTGVTAIAQSSSSIKVSWTQVTGATGYYVYRSNSSSGTYSKVKTITSGSTVSYTDTGLTANKTYYYKVSAYNAVGEGSKSSYAYATTHKLPPEPYGTFNKTTVTLAQGQTATFTVSGGVKNSTNLVYSVNGARPDGSGLGISSWVGHKVTGQSTFSETFTINATSEGEFYTPGTYTLKLWVRDAGVQTSECVDTMTVVIERGASPDPGHDDVVLPWPPTPTGVTATAQSSSSIKVSWTKVTGATGYYVYRSTSSSGTYSKVKTITSGSTVSYTDTGLSADTAYYYKVSAYNASGESALSAYDYGLTDPLELNLSATSWSPSSSAATKSITVSGVSSYAVSVDAEAAGTAQEWLTYTKSGSTLTLKVRANYGTASRTGTVTVTSGSQSKTITVKQGYGKAAPTVTLKIGSETLSGSDVYGPLTGGDQLWLNVYHTGAQRLFIRIYNESTGAHLVTAFDEAVSTSPTEWYPVLPMNAAAGLYTVEATATNSDVRNDPWAQKDVETFSLKVTDGDPYPNTHVNTGNYASDLVAVAATQSGYTGSDDSSNQTGADVTTVGNWTKYGAFTGQNNADWCASFVSWCADQANIPSTIISPSAAASPGHLCPKAKTEKGHVWYFELNAAMQSNHTYLANYGTKTSRSSFVPQLGDMIFFRWTPSATDYSFDHVGIVTKVSNGRVYYIDGNGTGDVVPGLYDKSYLLTNTVIQAYCRPW